jgi:PAS domain S-box-containing protein
MFEEMKRYIRFADEDERLLVLLRPVAAPHFQRIAAEFYDRIREHEDAHAVFTGEAQIVRLQSSLVRWMERVCSAPHDEAYFEETAKIGRMHVRIGLPQRYMFTAMALIRGSLERIAEESMGTDGPRAREAISRALDLELAIMLETYRDAYAARLQHIEREEKQEAQRTLRRTEHRYVSAVELARALIVGLDSNATIRLFNREAERVTGFARDEMLGKPFVASLFDAEHQEEQGPVFLAASAGARQLIDTVEVPLRTRSGQLRDVLWQLAYAPSDGEPDEVVLFAIGRDVTHENALAARVRQSEKLAAVGTLAAGLAHEIRNPLNGAQLHITFLERALRKSAAGDDALDAILVVREEIKRLGSLVSEFLDFARPKPLDLQPTSVSALCQRILPLTASPPGAKIVVQSQLPSTDFLVEMDAGKMEQVLLNLVRNAVEALEPAGSGTVTLRARRKPRVVVIEVEDDGPGLVSPDAPIFDPFFSTKASGTGLGLAIVHRIVSDHEGTIEVDSHPGHTVFRISLPIRSPLADGSQPQA